MSLGFQGKARSPLRAVVEEEDGGEGTRRPTQESELGIEFKR